MVHEFHTSRRAFVIGAASLVGLAACGGSKDNAAPQTSATQDPNRKVLITNFPFNGDYAVSGPPQRLVFLIGSADGAPIIDGAPESVDFAVTRDGKQIGETITVKRRMDGVPMPFYPLRFTFPEPGSYAIKTTIDGYQTGADIVVGAQADVPLVQPGDPIRPVETPTPDNHQGVEPICTAPTPCPLHSPTLASAVNDKKPIALLIGTPAYCQTGICGPVLDLLIEQQSSFPNVTFLHAEVYKDAAAVGNIAKATTTPVLDAYGLIFEPSLFLADGQGIVTERLDSAFDREELVSALKKISA